MQENLQHKPSFHVALVALYGVENTGVRYLCSFLKSFGIDVSIVFFREWRNNDNKPPDKKDTELLIKELKLLAPDLVGISFISSFVQIASDLTTEVKQKLEVPVVWGGIHCTTAPEECIEFADYVIMGEGEAPLLDLCTALKRGEDVSGIKNLCLKKGEDVLINPLRLLVQNLDVLPFPDYEDEGKVLIDFGKVTYGDPARNGAEYRIYTSRGCPFSCSYCYNSILREKYKGMGKYYRHRSVENVIAECEKAKELFPRLRRIKFDDDTAFGFGRKWIDDFCSLYGDRVGTPFECLIHPSLLKEEFLTKLKDAGLVKVQVGVESASEEEVSGVFHRKPSNDKVMEFAKLNKKLKLEVVYDVIIDNPLATEEDRRRMFDFLLSLPGPYKLYLYSLVVFPGTKLAEELVERGVITGDDVEGKNTKALSQFRVSLDWKRSNKDIFWLSLYLLVSKDFIPRRLLSWISKNEAMKRNPGVLFFCSKMTNFARMGLVALQMLFRGELTWFKIRQYSNLNKMISQ